jgi:hypothetical protein
MVQVNLDHPAKAFWVPSQIVSTTVSGGSDRDFESLRSAIFFVMERLPEFERATAFIKVVVQTVEARTERGLGA